jgi:hypothetical protein
VLPAHVRGSDRVLYRRARHAEGITVTPAKAGSQATAHAVRDHGFRRDDGLHKGGPWTSSPSPVSPGPITALSTPAMAGSWSVTAPTGSSDPNRRRCGPPPRRIGTRTPNSFPRPMTRMAVAAGISAKARPRAKAGRWRGTRSVSPRRLRRSAISASFPDMAPVWGWMREQTLPTSPKPRCMNLFGYTGVGTLALAATGARMTHVDASKKSVAEGKANAALSGMDRSSRSAG